MARIRRKKKINRPENKVPKKIQAATNRSKKKLFINRKKRKPSFSSWNQKTNKCPVLKPEAITQKWKEKENPCYVFITWFNFCSTLNVVGHFNRRGRAGQFSFPSRSRRSRRRCSATWPRSAARCWPASGSPGRAPDERCRWSVPRGAGGHPPCRWGCNILLQWNCSGTVNYLKFWNGARTGSIVWSFELFCVSYFGPELRSGTWECWLDKLEPLNFFEFYSTPFNYTVFRALLSSSKSSSAWPRFGPG